MKVSFAQVYDKPRELEKYISAAHGNAPILCLHLDDENIRHSPSSPTHKWTDEELKDRINDFRKLAIRWTSGWGTGFSEKSVERYARQASPMCSCMYNPQNVRRQFINSASDLLKVQPRKADLVVVFLPARTWTVSQQFGQISGGIDPSLLENVPSLEDLNLVTMRREFEHTFQDITGSPNLEFANEPLGQLWDYQCELSADVAAMKEAEASQIDARFWVLARAISSLLESDRAYWNALSIPRAIDGRSTLDFYQTIVPTVREVRLRIAGEMNDVSLKDYGSEEIRDAMRQFDKEKLCQSGALAHLLANEQSLFFNLADHCRDAILIIHRLCNYTVIDDIHSTEILRMANEWIETYTPSIIHYDSRSTAKPYPL